MIIKKALIPTALLLVSAIGFAATKAPDIKVDADVYEVFTALDVAGDGFITLEEAHAHGELFAKFNEVDLNGDGVIPLDEFEAFMAS